jgi:hypothetical protein
MFIKYSWQFHQHRELLDHQYHWMALDRWRLENAQAKAGGRQAGQWWTGGGPVATLRPAEASSSGAIKLLTNPGGQVRF